MNRQTILNRFSFYREASPALQSSMAAAGHYTTIAAGMFVYHEGDRCEQFALVGKGSIRVFKAEATGHEITLYHVQDGQACLVNVLSILLERPAVATAVAEVSTEAVIIPATAFRHWFESDQGMRKFVFESMATRLTDVIVLAQELAFHKMDQRLAHLLLERFSKERQSGCLIATTHEELAKELGSVREVISRLLKELERHGAIKISRGQIELLNEAWLKRMAE